MKKYLYEYIKLVETKIKDKKVDNLKEDLLIKISFFQHERLIHLLVTLFYAFLFLVFIVLISLSYVFVIPAIILAVFLICYIIHYFRLENGVQYLYNLYDKIEDFKNKRNKK